MIGGKFSEDDQGKHGSDRNLVDYWRVCLPISYPKILHVLMEPQAGFVIDKLGIWVYITLEVPC